MKGKTMKQKQKKPLLCKLGLHKWENIRDPKGVIPVYAYEGFGGAGQAYNRICSRCKKQDMFADRLREQLVEEEQLAKEAYGERE
jgi:hypothetical protein